MFEEFWRRHSGAEYDAWLIKTTAIVWQRLCRVS